MLCLLLLVMTLLLLHLLNKKNLMKFDTGIQESFSVMIMTEQSPVLKVRPYSVKAYSDKAKVLSVWVVL